MNRAARISTHFHRLVSLNTALKLAGHIQMKVVSLWSVNIAMIALCRTQLEQLKARLRYAFDSNTVKGHDLKAHLKPSPLPAVQVIPFSNQWTK